jgi:FKBP-type peptidyl-prolyl cis-trans isomerase FkpA
MKKHLILFCLVIIGLSSCKKGDLVSEQAAVDDAKIQAYLKANGITNAIPDPSGVYYQIVKQGTGGTPIATSTVQVSTTGTLLNGTQFTHAAAVNYKLNGTIKGWQVGIPHVKSGVSGDASSYGRIVLFIPSALAYGTTSSDVIPANSVLVFTIDLLGFY